MGLRSGCGTVFSSQEEMLPTAGHDAKLLGGLRNVGCFAELFRSASVMWRELLHGRDRTRLGFGGEPPPLHVFAHPSSEGSHHHPPVRVGHELSQ